MPLIGNCYAAYSHSITMKTVNMLFELDFYSEYYFKAHLNFSDPLLSPSNFSNVGDIFPFRLPCLVLFVNTTLSR